MLPMLSNRGRQGLYSDASDIHTHNTNGDRHRDRNRHRNEQIHKTAFRQSQNSATPGFLSLLLEGDDLVLTNL